MPKLDLSQGSAATYRRYGEKYYTSCWKFNWLSSRERIVKFFQMWQSYRHEFGVLLFCDTVYITYHDVSTWTWGWTRKSPINVLLTIWRETSSQGSLRIHCVQKAVPFCWRKTRRNIAIFFWKKDRWFLSRDCMHNAAYAVMQWLSIRLSVRLSRSCNLS